MKGVIRQRKQKLKKEELGKELGGKRSHKAEKQKISKEELGRQGSYKAEGVMRKNSTKTWLLMNL